MTMIVRPTAASAHERLAELSDIVAAHATDADRAARMADQVADALHASGLFRMLLPSELEGLGLTPPEAFDTFEAAAHLDGAVGWNLAIGAMSLFVAAARLAEDAARRVLSDRRALIAGSVNPGAVRAREADGGYYFTGKGTFASGSAHATWLMAAAITPTGELRAGLFERDAVTMLDSWHVSGMRATSSADFTLDEAYVPSELTFPLELATSSDRPIHELPLASRLGVALTFVALGIGAHAIDRVVTLANSRAPFGSPHPLADRADVQIAVARARALVDSGRAYVKTTWHDANSKLRVGSSLTFDDLARLRLSYVTATRNAIEATDAAWAAAGSAALYEGEPLERCWRDAHAVGQHAFVSIRHLDRIGRISLGLPAGPGPI